jgi:hypothetical protein
VILAANTFHPNLNNRRETMTRDDSAAQPDLITPEVRDRIVRFRLSLSEVDDRTAEETLQRFRQDYQTTEELEHNLSMWEAIAQAYQTATSSGSSPIPAQKREIYGLLLHLTMAMLDPTVSAGDTELVRTAKTAFARIIRPAMQR